MAEEGGSVDVSHAEEMEDSGCALMGVTAESGCGVEGVSFRHRSCCDAFDIALRGAMALAGVPRLDHGSAAFAKSGCALMGTALCGYADMG
jgi:hypothetical protein